MASTKHKQDVSIHISITLPTSFKIVVLKNLFVFNSITKLKIIIWYCVCFTVTKGLKIIITFGDWIFALINT